MVQGDFDSTSSPAVRRPSPPRELNVFDHIHVIYRYRWLILPLCILAAGAAGTITYLWPPSYVATASVVPPAEGGGQMGLGMSLLGGSGASLLRQVMDISSTMDMYVGILGSRAVEDAIVDRFDLVRVYEKPTRYKTVRRLRKNTSINSSNEGILYVTVEDADPNRAAAMANAYVEELDKQNKKLSVGQATSKRVFLETRLKEVEQKLSRIDSLPSREAQVQEMLYELLIRELELAKIEEAKSMPTIQVLDPAVPPETRKPRGTVTKAALAGIVAFVCAVFLAFIREYYVECGRCDQQDVSPGRDRRGTRGDATDMGDGRPAR
jgi:uncharacterized protein involved in exopolysaccharide biosynthesis